MDTVRKPVESLITELNKVVVGYDDIKRLIVYGLLGDVHLLIESVPGLAKTLLVESLQAAIANSSSNRIQLTPDMLPGDITGVRVYNPGTRSFDIEFGPAYETNFLLADEINRTPGKTQSALLSAMQERKIVIAGKIYKLKDPFLVLATMNPIEQEGTYPLPEAQLDRFGMKITMDYLPEDDELKILDNAALDGRDAWKLVSQAISVEDIVRLREEIKREVFVSRAAKEYIVALVQATRPNSPRFKEVVSKGGTKLTSLIKVGCSPRAEQTLQKLARVRAACEGRSYVLPDDIQALTHEVLRHRMMLSDDAIFDGIPADEAVAIIMKHVPLVTDLEQYKRG